MIKTEKVFRGRNKTKTTKIWFLTYIRDEIYGFTYNVFLNIKKNPSDKIII